MVRSHNEALTVDQLLLIGDIAEEDWLKSNSEEEKKELDSTIAFSTISFFMYLQVEEVPLILIEGMNIFWMETWNCIIPHMAMTLKGIFKGGGNCGGIVFRCQTKQIVVYLQEGGSVGYSTSDVI